MSEHIERVDIFAELHDGVSKPGDKIERELHDIQKAADDTSGSFHKLSKEQEESEKAAKKAKEQTYLYNRAIADAERAAADYVKIIRVQNQAKTAEAKRVEANAKLLSAETRERDRNIRKIDAETRARSASTKARAEETKVIQASAKAKEADAKLLRQETHERDRDIRKLDAETRMRNANNKVRELEIKAIDASLKAVQAEQKVVDSLNKSKTIQNDRIKLITRAREADLKAVELDLRKAQQLIQSQAQQTNALNALTKAKALNLRVTVNQQQQQAKLAKQQAKTTQGIKNQTSQISTFRKVVNGALFGLDEFITKIFSLRTLFSIFKIGTIASAIGNLIGGLASIGAAAYAAVAGLSPLVSNVAILPGLLLAGGQGMGTFALGIYGVANAIKVLMDPNADPTMVAEALSKLAPAARDFVSEIMKARPAFKDLRLFVQDRLFQGLAGTFKDLSTEYLPLLRTNLGLTADALNVVFKYWSGIFMRPDMIKTVANLLSGNAKVIQLIGMGLGEWGAAFAKIALYAMPTLTRMSNDFFQAGINFGEWVDRHSQDITNFFSNGYDLLKEVWQVIKDISVGLYNIGKASDHFGKKLGTGFSDWAKNFKEWTGSDEGQSRLKDFFNRMEPIFDSILRLFGKLGDAIVKISETPGIDKIFNKIGNLAGPIGKFIRAGMNGGYLDSFIKVIRALARVAAAGWLGVAAKAFSALADALNIIAKVISKIPGPMKDTLGSIMGILFAYGLVSRVGKSMGIKSLIGRGAVGAASKVATGGAAASGAAAIAAGGVGRAAAGGGLGKMVPIIGGGSHAGKFVGGGATSIAAGGSRGRGFWANASKAGGIAKGGLSKLLSLRTAGGLMVGNYAMQNSDSALKGIGGGALSGGLVGSNFGPWGAAIGTAIGGLVGSIKYWDTKVKTEASKHVSSFLRSKFSKDQIDKMLGNVSQDHRAELKKAITNDPVKAEASLKLSQRLGYYVPPVQADAYKRQMNNNFGWDAAAPNKPAPLIKPGAPGSVEANDAWIKSWNQQANEERRKARLARSQTTPGFMKLQGWDKKQSMVNSYINRQLPDAGAQAFRDSAGMLGLGSYSVRGDNTSAAKVSVLKTIKSGDQAISDYMANIEKQFVRDGGKTDKISDALSAFDSVVQEINHFLEVTKSRMGSFAQQIRYRSIYGISQGGLLEGTYTGGAVGAGEVRSVGEKGPEAFMSKSGALEMVGMGGPEIVRFAQAGAVVNNAATTNPWTSTPQKTPKWALDAMQGTYSNIASFMLGSKPSALDARFAENAQPVSTAARARISDSQAMQTLSMSVSSLADSVARSKTRAGRQVNDSRNGNPPKTILNVNGGSFDKGQLAAWFREVEASERERRNADSG